LLYGHERELELATSPALSQNPEPISRRGMFLKELVSTATILDFL